MNAKEKLRQLAQRLKTCPSLDTSINSKLLFETWKSFRQLDPEHGDTITPAMILAIILFDEEVFGPLLTHAETTQLLTTGHKALERYQLRTNPPNQPGKLLAASIKEST